MREISIKGSKIAVIMYKDLAVSLLPHLRCILSSKNNSYYIMYLRINNQVDKLVHITFFCLWIDAGNRTWVGGERLCFLSRCAHTHKCVSIKHLIIFSGGCVDGHKLSDGGKYISAQMMYCGPKFSFQGIFII